jgi:hypothetical protein
LSNLAASLLPLSSTLIDLQLVALVHRMQPAWGSRLTWTCLAAGWGAGGSASTLTALTHLDLSLNVKARLCLHYSPNGPHRAAHAAFRNCDQVTGGPPCARRVPAPAARCRSAAHARLTRAILTW